MGFSSGLHSRFLWSVLEDCSSNDQISHTRAKQFNSSFISAVLSQHYLPSFLLSVPKRNVIFVLLVVFFPNRCTFLFFPQTAVKVLWYWRWNCPGPRAQSRLFGATFLCCYAQKAAESFFLRSHLLCSPSSIHILRSRWIVMHLEPRTGGEYSHT